MSFHSNEIMDYKKKKKKKKKKKSATEKSTILTDWFGICQFNTIVTFCENMVNLCVIRLINGTFSSTIHFKYDKKEKTVD